MKHTLALLLALTLASPLEAACYADYKAKQDGPLRLHYGVAQIPDEACSKQGARAYLGPRLAREGWALLGILSTFGPEGLDERRANASPYFLRF